MPLLTKIEKPEELNSTVMTALAVEFHGGIANPGYRQFLLNMQQFVLDGLVKRGILK